MKKKLPYFLLVLFIGSFILPSCQKELQNDSIENESVNPDVQLIAQMGFDVNDIEEYDDYFVVEGDILIDKKQLKEYTTTRQAEFGGPLIKLENQRITIGVSPELRTESNWLQATQSAVSIWTGVNNCNITVNYTTNLGSADIVVYKGSLNYGVIAMAGFPVNRKAYSQVMVSTSYNYFTLSQKTWIMVHEIGHCLGLRHTDWEQYGEPRNDGNGNYARDIPGTPKYDPNSVMNKYYSNQTWNGFSNGDITAIQYLYPPLPVISLTANKEYCMINESVSVKLTANDDNVVFENLDWSYSYDFFGVFTERSPTEMDVLFKMPGYCRITCRGNAIWNNTESISFIKTVGVSVGTLAPPLLNAIKSTCYQGESNTYRAYRYNENAWMEWKTIPNTSVIQVGSTTQSADIKFTQPGNYQVLSRMIDGSYTSEWTSIPTKVIARCPECGGMSSTACTCRHLQVEIDNCANQPISGKLYLYKRTSFSEDYILMDEMEFSAEPYDCPWWRVRLLPYQRYTLVGESSFNGEFLRFNFIIENNEDLIVSSVSASVQYPFVDFF